MSDQDSDKPEKPDTEGLESLLGGLDFTPDWAKREPGVHQAPGERRGREDRGGGPRGPRAPSKSARRGLEGVRVKPRRDAPPRGGRGGGRPDGGFRDDRRGGPRRERAARPPRVPVHVDFIPEKKRLSKVVKVIRQSHRAYPLRVVAEKFMENPAFLSMKYTVREKEPEAADFHLYVCRANGMVFSDEQACVQYVLEHGLEANYEKTEREVDPPSGNFLCVGRHRVSGRLIGPPNWHGYQPRLEALRREAAPDTPPEAFSSQIVMDKDPEAIEAWKKEVSVKTFYRPRLEETEAPAKTKDKTKSGAGAGVPAAEAVESDPSDPSDKAPEPEAAEPGAAEPGVSETSDGSDKTDGSDASQPGPPPPPAPPEDTRPYDLTREQAEAEFREKYLPKLIGKARRAIMPGYLFPKMTDPGLESLTRFHLNRESHRPNSIVFALRPAFKHMRLHVFRYEGELMVGGVEQHPMPADLKVTPEIRNILDHVASHPGCNTQEALRTVANTTGEVLPAEIVSHFRWLIEKGHLLEFHDDTLHLPHGNQRG